MKKFLSSLLAVIMGMSLIAPAPVFADGNDRHCVSTSILGEDHEVCDDGEGGSIIHILDLVVEIMSIGVGILGVIGISIVGVQYLTAGGSEEKTRKAKRRLLEIVIGLVVYAIFYAILTFLGVNKS